jgi:hypothetical protein
MNALERLIAASHDAYLQQREAARAGRPCPQDRTTRPRKARRIQPPAANASAVQTSAPSAEEIAVDWDAEQAKKRLLAALKRRQNSPQVFSVPFPLNTGNHQPKTTAEYVAEFCRLNGLIHSQGGTHAQ